MAVLLVPAIAAASHHTRSELLQDRYLGVLERLVDQLVSSQITDPDGRQWQLNIESGGVPHTLSYGGQRNRYYIPFPGFNAYPLYIRFHDEGPATFSYSVKARQ